MIGYRNCYYSGREKAIHLWTWNEAGERIETIEPFQPYLYVETTSDPDAKSIFNTPLRKITFNDQFQRKKYLADNNIKRVFGNLKAEQQYLIEKYNNFNETEEFSKFPLKIFYIDIEVHVKNCFPKPEEANFPINLITIQDSLSGNYYTFGLQKDYKPKEKNIKYVKCKSEEELLKMFVAFWCRDYPDIITGYNIDGFDIPYLINRITKLLGSDLANKLSPVNFTFLKKVHVKQFGQKKEVNKWMIGGCSIVDYMPLYQYYAKDKLEKYSLDFVANYELGEGKTSYNATNLAKLSEQDWDLFVDYNIQDVKLITLLEKKLKFLQTSRNLSYIGLSGFESALSKTSIITGAIALEALKTNRIIPTFTDNIKESYDGGLVRDIELGLKEDLVILDVNSLYPNVFVTLNASMETEIGKFSIEEDNVNIKLTNNKTYTLKKDYFYKFIKKEEIAISAHNVMYSQKTIGIIPSLITRLYNQRVLVKNDLEKIEHVIYELKEEMKNATDKVLKKEIKDKIVVLELKSGQLDITQYTIKILLNSIYGMAANAYSPLFSMNLASSITLTGQLVNRSSGDIAQKVAKEIYGIEETHKIVEYGDTDSIFLTLKPILNKLNLKLVDKNGKITKKVQEISDTLTREINKRIKEWARTDLNSKNPTFEFKKEYIADAAIFTSKKFYLLHIIDKGDVGQSIPCDKMIYKGVKVATSTMSDPIKKLIKNLIENVIKSRNEVEANRLYKELYEKFKLMSHNDISFRSSINNLDKYNAKCDKFVTGKGTPAHVISSLYYNQIIKDMAIDNNYEAITSGNKIKWFYCNKNNKWGIDRIGYNDKFPEELIDIIKPDVELMFSKLVMPVLQPIFSSVNWRFQDLRYEVACDIFNLV